QLGGALGQPGQHRLLLFAASGHRYGEDRLLGRDLAKRLTAYRHCGLLSHGATLPGQWRSNSPAWTPARKPPNVDRSKVRTAPCGSLESRRSTSSGWRHTSTQLPVE